MSTSKDTLKWNVFREDFNARKIYTYNIFDHYSFWEDLVECNKNYADDGEFYNNAKRWLQYYYWCKAEHEILMKGMFSEDKYASKIDIYSQIMLNEERFKEYLISHRSLIPTRISKKTKE